MSKRRLRTSAIGPGAEFLATRQRRCARVIGALLAIGLLIGVVKLILQMRSPDTALLVSSHGAHWIIEDRPIDVASQELKDLTVTFRRTINLASLPARAVLQIRGFRSCSASLDSRPILTLGSDSTPWRQPREVDLMPHLTAGEHTLIISVSNDRGPPALEARCSELNLVTDGRWEASRDQLEWKPVRLADATRQPELSDKFPTVGPSLLSSMPAWLTVMIATACAIMLLRDQSSLGRFAARVSQPSAVRWILMTAWAALGVNNLLRVHSSIAFDGLEHMQYIEYVGRYGRIPLADDGWQMFQSPLYYILCAPIDLVSQHWLGLDGRAMVVRIVPVLCGLGMIEILRRVMRRVFPDRADLQSLGMLFGAWLPMNVYISQMVGNEPMAGLTSAWVILLALGLNRDLARNARTGPFVVIGLVLGLALLSKATAILLVPIITVWLAACLWSHGATITRLWRSLAYFGVTAAIVSGWYYGRNLIEFGKPFVGGWDPVRKFEWWQDPGYRTPAEFFRFGHALTKPMLAAFAGFWDALYSTMWTEGYLSGRTTFEARPPWNEHFLIAGSPLGLIPTLLLSLGILVLLRNPQRAGKSPLLLSCACLAVYLAALLQLYLQLPIFSTVKASYLLGITPCLAIIAMSGAQVLMKNRWSRAIITGLMIGWAVNVYCTYFVVQTIAPTAQ